MIDRRLLIALLFAPVILIAGAAPPVHAAPPDPFAGDGRLSQRITLEARRRPVPEVLEAISRQTGVSLRAERPAHDLRVHAFLNGAADTTLRRLAELLHLTWRRVEGKEPAAYSLMEAQVDVEAAQGVRRSIARATREHLHRLSLAATQPEKLGDSPLDQAAKIAMRSGFAPGLVRLLHTLGESAQDQLVQQGRLVFSGETLSPALVRVAADFRLAQVPPNPSPGEKRLAEAPLVLVSFTLEQHPRLSLSATFRNAGGGGMSYDFPLFGSLPNLYRDEERHFGERLVTPSLAGPLQSPPPSARLDDALAQFAQQSHVSVMADAVDADFPIVAGVTPGAPLEKTSLPHVLDRLCFPYDYTWNAQDRLLLFRRRDWPVARDQQISVTQEREWQQAAREGGAYTLAQLAEMAVLNREQRKKLIRYAGTEASRVVNGRSTRPFLLLLAALTSPQRAQLLREGLRSDRFNPQQAHLLEPVVAALRPGPLDLPHSFQQLEIREDPGTRASTAILRFRDGEIRSLVLDRTAKPLPDPGGSRWWSQVAD